MITYVQNSGTFLTARDGTQKVIGTLLSSEELEAEAPFSLTGADVAGLDDDTILGAGCALITPLKNYLAFQDGVFNEKGSSGSSSGGGGMFVVTIASDGSIFNPTYTVDKSCAEVYAAFSGGQFVIGVKNGSTGFTIYNLSSISLDGDEAVGYILGRHTEASTDLFFVEEVDGETTITRSETILATDGGTPFGP